MERVTSKSQIGTIHFIRVGDIIEDDTLIGNDGKALKMKVTAVNIDYDPLTGGSTIKYTAIPIS